MTLVKSPSQLVKQIDEGTGMSEEGMGRDLAASDFIGLSADYFFEGFAVTGRKSKEFLDKEEMEKFLFDFGVHQDFVAHVGHQSSYVDSFSEPTLAYQLVDLGQRNNVLTLETLTGSHALLVGWLESPFS